MQTIRLLTLGTLLAVAACKSSMPAYPPPLEPDFTNEVLQSAKSCDSERGELRITLVGARLADNCGIYFDILVEGSDAAARAKLLADAAMTRVGTRALFKVTGENQRTLALAPPRIVPTDYVAVPFVPFAGPPSFDPGTVVAQTYTLATNSCAALQTIPVQVRELARPQERFTAQLETEWSLLTTDPSIKSAWARLGETTVYCDCSQSLPLH